MKHALCSWPLVFALCSITPRPAAAETASVWSGAGPGGLELRPAAQLERGRRRSPARRLALRAVLSALLPEIAITVEAGGDRVAVLAVARWSLDPDAAISPHELDRVRYALDPDERRRHLDAGRTAIQAARSAWVLGLDAEAASPDAVARAVAVLRDRALVELDGLTAP